jgi:glyoxylate reductase
VTTVAVLGLLPEGSVQPLVDAGYEIVDSGDPASIVGAVAIITVLSEQIDAELLDRIGPSLRVVANVAAGYDNIDLDACRQRGIAVSNTPGVLTDATADLTMALVLMVMRRLGAGERLVRSGAAWSWAMDFHLGADLCGATVGIIGSGRIGAAVARRAEAFGMNVLFHSRSIGTELFDVLGRSDVVSIHCPLTEGTHHLMSREAFAAMRPTAFVVNTSRGPVVDEAALVDALDSRVIAGAALDVFEHEPSVHPGLLGRDDVVLLPHLGSATVQTRRAMADRAVANALSFLQRRTLLDVVVPPP